MEVKEGTEISIKKSFDISIVTESALTTEDEAALNDEIRILKLLDHEHLNKLHDIYDKKLYYYLVLEKMDGGELFDYIFVKAYYNEKGARGMCKIIFQAMAYCHEKHIVHHNLKPENLLLMVRAFLFYSCVKTKNQF